MSVNGLLGAFVVTRERRSSGSQKLPELWVPSPSGPRVAGEDERVTTMRLHTSVRTPRWGVFAACLVPLAHSGKVGHTGAMARSSQVTTRNTDSKGRLTLGDAFRNRTVIVEQRGDELVVRLARVIPETEAWLYANPDALASVRRGLAQAKGKALAKRGPDLAAARRLADRLKDE